MERLILSLLFGSGGKRSELAVRSGEPCDFALAVEACCLAGNTAITSLQLRSGGGRRKEEGRRRTRRRRRRSRADIKFDKPHLTGGAKTNKKQPEKKIGWGTSPIGTFRRTLLDLFTAPSAQLSTPGPESATRFWCPEKCGLVCFGYRQREITCCLSIAAL